MYFSFLKVTGPNSVCLETLEVKMDKMEVAVMK